MALRINPAPYQRSKNSTFKTMMILTISLGLIWILSIINGFSLSKGMNLKLKGAYNLGVRAILMVLIAVVVAVICDVITALTKHKKGAKYLDEIIHQVVYNYSYVTAIIFALTMPFYASYYSVIIGTVFAVVVCKNLFGGFGKNIFNPAAMARIFVALCFTFEIPAFYKTSGLDAITGSTLTTAFNNSQGWLGTTLNYSGATFNSIFEGYSIGDLMLGKYVGALGETFTIAIFVIGIALSVLKVINWRTPVFYLGTVSLTAFIIALVCGFSNPFAYVLYHLSLGGLMFGAVFMLTDPVSGPTSPFGKCVIGVFAGLITMLIRIKGGYPEGVVYSIALCNFISPAIDYFTVGKSSEKQGLKYGITFGGVAVTCLLMSILAFNANGGKSVYEVNGMSKASYDYITEKISLNEGETLEVATDYTAKTDKIMKVASYKTNMLNEVYYIKNGNNVVAIVYGTSFTGEIQKGEGYGDNFTCNGLVAIDNNGKIRDIGLVSGYYGFNEGYETAVSGGVDNFVGLGEGDYSTTNISGATYSSNLIKGLIENAYVEYNAYKGGQ